jgi:hypothetical protein
MVLGQELSLTLVGTALGAAVSVGSVHVLRAWMYAMSVYDAPTLGAVRCCCVPWRSPRADAQRAAPVV